MNKHVDLAILHAVLQGAIKLVQPASGDTLPLALVRMTVAAFTPWIVLAVPLGRPSDHAAKSVPATRAGAPLSSLQRILFAT